MTGLRACLGTQEAPASLQLVLGARTLKALTGESATITTAASQRSTVT